MKQGIPPSAGQPGSMYLVDASRYTVPEILLILPFVLYESVLTMCRSRAHWSESRGNDGDVSPPQIEDLTRFL